MKIRYIPSIFFLLLIFIQPAFAESEYVKFIHQHGKEILKKYRIPEGEDLSYWGTDKNTYFYKSPDGFGKAKAPYWSNGYFNEDEILDYVYILFKRDNNKPFLIGFLYVTSSYKSYIIGESEKTMCAATDNSDAIKKKVKLRTYPKHIIQHFHLEGHGMIIYWDTDQKRFIFYK
jgi:hypothetical protein